MANEGGVDERGDRVSHERECTGHRDPHDLLAELVPSERQPARTNPKKKLRERERESKLAGASSIDHLPGAPEEDAKRVVSAVHGVSGAAVEEAFPAEAGSAHASDQEPNRAQCVATTPTFGMESWPWVRACVGGGCDGMHMCVF